MCVCSVVGRCSTYIQLVAKLFYLFLTGKHVLVGGFIDRENKYGFVDIYLILSTIDFHDQFQKLSKNLELFHFKKRTCLFRQDFFLLMSIPTKVFRSSKSFSNKFLPTYRHTYLQ